MRFSCLTPAAASLALLFTSLSPAAPVPFEKYQLPNGMTVILHEDHRLPTVTVNTWFRVGSKDEAPGRSGFAHLFEHLMFMGTERVPNSEFDKIMEAGGGSNNASTWSDQTRYFSIGPAKLLPTLLWLDADRLEGLPKAMTKEKLDLQRNVVLNERRQNTENTPYGESQVRLQEMLYPYGHPYHMETIGRREDIEAATVQDVKTFFYTYYVPNNATLVVAGDFDSKAIKPLLGDLFGTLPRAAEPPKPAVPPTRLDHEVREVLTDEVQYPMITFAYHSPGGYAEGDADMELLASVLASGKTSRLYKRLVYDEQLAADVGAYQNGELLGGRFLIYVTVVDPANVARVEKEVDEEIARLKKEGVNREELHRAQAKQETRLLAHREKLEDLADQMNEYEFYWGNPDGFDQDLERFRKVTTGSLSKWARKILAQDARLVMTVMPRKGSPGEVARGTRPAVGPDAPVTPPKPGEFQLSNGINVAFWERHDLPKVGLRLLFEGGSDQDSKGRGGAAELAGQMLSNGTTRLDALEFDDDLDALGGSFRVDTGREFTTVSVEALRKNWEGTLALASDALQSPAMDKEEWERTRKEHLDDLQQQFDDPEAVGRIAALKFYYGEDNPRAVPTDGTPTTVAALTLEDIDRARRAIFRPDSCRVFLAGDLTAAEARAMLERSFGSWKTTDPVPPSVKVTAPPPKPLRIGIVDRPGAVQTSITFTMPAPRFADPRRTGLQTLNILFGGAFTSRLNANLRENKGYTYGVASMFLPGRQMGTAAAMAAVRSDVTADAIREFVTEFKRLREDKVTDEEAAKSRESFRYGQVSSLETIDGLLGRATQYAEHRLPLSTVTTDLALVSSMDPLSLEKLAKEAYPFESGTLTLVGDRKAILEQLARTNVGIKLPEPVTIELDGMK